jgi:hypothetical protein
MYLIVDFLCLLKAAQPARIEAHRSFYARRGLLLSIDAMQPEKGNDVLYMVRELRKELTLQAVKVSNQRADTIRIRVLEPVQALGFPVGGIVSDAEDAIHRACQDVWPGRPHQASQMVKIKHDLRSKLSPVRRAIQALDEADPSRAVLLDYAEALRSCFRVSGVAPFRLGGLRVLDDLRAVAASLRRCKKNTHIRYWSTCWLQRGCIETTWSLPGALAVNGSGS